jgi:hypothetical protein
MFKVSVRTEPVKRPLALSSRNSPMIIKLAVPQRED